MEGRGGVRGGPQHARAAPFPPGPPSASLSRQRNKRQKAGQAAGGPARARTRADELHQVVRLGRQRRGKQRRRLAQDQHQHPGEAGRRQQRVHDAGAGAHAEQVAQVLRARFFRRGFKEGGGFRREGCGWGGVRSRVLFCASVGGDGDKRRTRARACAAAVPMGASSKEPPQEAVYPVEQT